jgi:hypothetical protein
VDSLEAIVEGIIFDSAAYPTNLSVGSKILSVDGTSVYSRVDAYNRLYAAANPKVHFEKDGESFSCVIDKTKNTSSGLVFNYDIDPEAAKRIKRKVEKFSSQECLVLVSKLGYGILSKVLAGADEVKISIAANIYFGGNIMCAGLLVLEDIETALKQQNKLPQVVFLPQVMFDEKGRDLTGRHYLELEQNYGVTVVVM